MSNNTTNRCILCGWLLNDEHIFNVKCAAANAENDQLEAEVRELQAEAKPEPYSKIDEVMLDVLAYARFKRNLRG